MTVRDAVTADAERIAEFERLYIDCPWTKEQVQSAIAARRGEFLTAIDGGRAVGYISCDVCADEGELNNIAVDASMRRRGIARALMNELISRLAARNVEKLFLLVRADNTAAKALYESCGFDKVGVRKGYYRGADAVIMERRIER